MTRRTIQSLFLMSIAGLLLDAQAESQSKELRDLRDATVWLRAGPGSTGAISWEDYYAGESTRNYIYVQAPDGTLIERIELTYGDPGGSQELLFSAGPGDYRIELPGYFFRRGTVTVSDDVDMLLEPAKGQPCIHTNTQLFYFSVPEATASFTLCGRTDMGTSAILLFRPGGLIYGTLNLTPTPIPALFFDRLEVPDPEPGIWSIRYTSPGKAAFWVDGIGNYFSPVPEDLFVPEWRPGSAVFSGSAEQFARGRIGSFLINQGLNPQIYDNLEYMELESYNYYATTFWREPYNPAFPDGGDNGDPDVFDWSWFNWDDARIEYYREDLQAQLSTLMSSVDSWLGVPMMPVQLAEFGEFMLACVTHHNADCGRAMKWFAPWDEPNLATYTYEQYEQLLLAVAARLKDPAAPQAVRDTALLGASTSGFDLSNSGAERLGRRWAHDLYAAHDSIIDGFAFDYWWIRDLVETRRFEETVEELAELIATHDTDGVIDEQIVINQTSMNPGSDSSAYDVNTHFGARWVTGAVCRGIGTGKLDVFHYFTAIDDDRHMKGLMYYNNPPPALPYKAQAAPYELKPMGHALAMLCQNAQDVVLRLHGESVEVDALLTHNPDEPVMVLNLVNKVPRRIHLLIETALPELLQNRNFLGSVTQFGPQHALPERMTSAQPLTTTTQLRFEYDLEPETVYAFRFEPPAVVEVPALGMAGLVVLAALMGFSFSRGKRR